MGQPALSDDELYYTDMAVGEILRRTREHYGQSLSDIERALRIRASLIEAIEGGHAEKLPGRVYAIGFVRSYSEYLGLDGNKMVHLFKIQDGGKAASPQLHFPAPASESKIPPVWVVVASLIAIVLLIAGWWMFQSGDRTVVTEIPEVPAEMKTNTTTETQIENPLAAEQTATVSPEDGSITLQSTPAPVTPAAATPPAETASLPQSVPASTPAAATPSAPTPAPTAEQKQGIILNITQNSWVEIRDRKGNIVVSKVLKAGDQYYVPDRPDLKISLGNAGGIKLEVDGKALAPLGKAGEVRKDVPLDAAYLKKNFAKKTEN